MADTAAHLVDRVLLAAPYRQWVLSVPKPLRLRLARDPEWARAELLRRVFADDVLRCPCGGRRTVVAVVTVVAVARVVLATLGLPTELATPAPARGPPQGDLWCDDASA